MRLLSVFTLLILLCSANVLAGPTKCLARIVAKSSQPRIGEWVTLQRDGKKLELVYLGSTQDRFWFLELSAGKKNLVFVPKKNVRTSFSTLDLLEARAQPEDGNHCQSYAGLNCLLNLQRRGLLPQSRLRTKLLKSEGKLVDEFLAEAFPFEDSDYDVDPDFVTSGMGQFFEEAGLKVERYKIDPWEQKPHRIQKLNQALNRLKKGATLYLATDVGGGEYDSKNLITRKMEPVGSSYPVSPQKNSFDVDDPFASLSIGSHVVAVTDYVVIDKKPYLIVLDSEGGGVFGLWDAQRLIDQVESDDGPSVYITVAQSPQSSSKPNSVPAKRRSSDH